MHEVIAIDGPAAAGKSTVASLLAAELSYIFVSSGNVYRELTQKLLEGKVNWQKAQEVARFAEGLRLGWNVAHGEATPSIESMPLSTNLHREEINEAVSTVASYEAVRTVVTRHLREARLIGDIVMEGRDIGAVVFPDATWKFYVDARPEVRMARRASEGIGDTVLERDRIDSSRQTSPLRLASDAVRIDTSDLTPAQAVRMILSFIRKD